MTDKFEENRFSFQGILEIFIINKSFVIFASLVIAILSLNYALGLPNIYSAEAVLVPSKQSDRGSGASMGGGGSNIAELVGLSGGSSSDRTSVSLKVLESKDFFSPNLGICHMKCNNKSMTLTCYNELLQKEYSIQL